MLSARAAAVLPSCPGRLPVDISSAPGLAWGHSWSASGAALLGRGVFWADQLGGTQQLLPLPGLQGFGTCLHSTAAHCLSQWLQDQPLYCKAALQRAGCFHLGMLRWGWLQRGTDVQDASVLQPTSGSVIGRLVMPPDSCTRLGLNFRRSFGN